MRVKEQWIILVIMSCTTSVNYSILVNGRVGIKFTPSRGWRQKDLLSPYFFLFYAEGLSSMINKVEQRGDIQGVAVSRGDRCISHLLFADDSIIFYRATQDEWIKIKTILH